MRVLVTGGSGLLGRRTIAVLAARGHEVVALQRHRERRTHVRAGARLTSATRRRWRRRQQRCDAVIHGAARVGVVGPRDEFRRVNVGGTEAVVAACREAGVKRLVFVSSPSVGYESVPTVGAGARAPITTPARPLLVLGVEGRGGARGPGRERPDARGDGDPAARDLGAGGYAADRADRRPRARRAPVRRSRWHRPDRHDLCRQRRRRARRRSGAPLADERARRPRLRDLERRAAAGACAARVDLRGGGRAAAEARRPAAARPGDGGRQPSACGLAPDPMPSHPQRGSSSTSSPSRTGSILARSARRRGGHRRSALPRACFGSLRGTARGNRLPGTGSAHGSDKRHSVALRHTAPRPGCPCETRPGGRGGQHPLRVCCRPRAGYRNAGRRR